MKDTDTKPLIILSLGAGVQSSALALMAAQGEIGPMPDCAIFADTQAEPESVYNWLDWLEKQLPFEVHRVTAGKLDDKALNIQTNRKTGKEYYSNAIPAFVDSQTATGGQVGRYCTRDYKLRPLLKKQRQLAKVPRGCKTVKVISWIGISLDEVTRMKPSRDPWSENVWPLVDNKLTRHDCKLWMERNGYPEPPRSACVYCPYHSNHEWRRLRDEEPLEFERAAEFEKELQRTHAKIQSPGKLIGIPYLHRSMKPLKDVDLTTEADRGQLDFDMFQNDCEGMCGL
jgi:hypothetical protein